jgi:hypothetical protein
LSRISQREAQRLRKRVAELERNHQANARAWTRDYVGGVHVASLNADAVTLAQLRASRRLGFALVATVEWSGDVVAFHAVKA